jgi:hypothetical protein
VNEIMTGLIETIRTSTHAVRLDEALRVLRIADAAYSDGIKAAGGYDAAPDNIIDSLDSAVYDANEAALWAAEQLKCQLDDATQQFGMFFASAWGEGGAFAVWIAPELGWCCQPETQVAGFDR